MSRNETKILFEGWRRYLTEAETIDPQTAMQTDKLLKLPYARFATSFKGIAQDPKVKAVLTAGTQDGNPEDEKLTVEDGKAIPLVSLKPTQNEVVFDKSLGGEFGPLQKVETLELFLKGGSVKVPGPPKGQPYIITAEGKYIVDGHHRWSSLFCINPKSSILSTNMIFSKPLNPLVYLKITQIAIAADVPKIPDASGGGVNLFTTNENYVKTEVPKQIEAGANKQQIMQKFAEFGHKDINAINNLIWNNITQLQKIKPVAGAPERIVMPQTDKAVNLKQRLSSGELNFINVRNTPAGGKAAAKPAAPEAAPVQEEFLRESIKKYLLQEMKKNK